MPLTPDKIETAEDLEDWLAGFSNRLYATISKPLEQLEAQGVITADGRQIAQSMVQQAEKFIRTHSRLPRHANGRRIAKK